MPNVVKGQGNTEKHKNNKAMIILCIVGVIIIAVLIGIILSMMNKEEGKDKRPVVVTEENMDEILDTDEPDEE